MTHLLERLRPRKKFFKADILSRFGETICLPPLEIVPPDCEKVAPTPIEPQRAWQEEPERWDGLS
jgi:hypothetical protein